MKMRPAPTLAGKVVAITGAARGIGREIALLAAREGACVLVKSMSADKIAPLAVFLCGDAARDVTGQIFCVRKNEIFLFSLPRPIRSMHRAEGWSPTSIAEELLPAFRPSFQPLQRSVDVFSWDPI